MTKVGLDMIGLSDLEQPLPDITEAGRTPLENAEIKAKAYYAAFHMPVFSCDSGLYFEELPDEEQPGLFVRRVGGKELTDDEMIEYYGSLAARHGGKLTGRYWNAVCFVYDESHIFCSMDRDLSTEPFLLVSVPHEKRVDGFPLDSLSRDLETGMYYYDLKTKDVSTSCIEEGYARFFSECLQQVTSG